MKKEIIALVKSEEGYFRLNNISYLHRWTKDWADDKVDCLVLEFDNINHVNFSLCDREIKSRDYDGIMAECQALTERFLAAVAKELCSNMRAGYRNREN